MHLNANHTQPHTVYMQTDRVVCTDEPLFAPLHLSVHRCSLPCSLTYIGAMHISVFALLHTLRHRFYKMTELKLELQQCLCGNLQSNGSLWSIFNWINNWYALAMMCFQRETPRRLMKLNAQQCLTCIWKWYHRANNNLRPFFSRF